MRCRICRQPAGWLRRACSPCSTLYGIVRTHRGAGLSHILDLLIETGISNERIEAFLASEPEGRGTIRDQIVADMTNQLMEALGQRGGQTAADVKRLREQGAWSAYDQRPST